MRNISGTKDEHSFICGQCSLLSPKLYLGTLDVKELLVMAWTFALIVRTVGVSRI